MGGEFPSHQPDTNAATASGFTPHVLAIFPPELAERGDLDETLNTQMAQYLTMLVGQLWPQPRAHVRLTPLIYLLGRGGDDAGALKQAAYEIGRRASMDLFGSTDTPRVEVSSLYAASDAVEALLHEHVGDAAVAEAVETLETLERPPEPANTWQPISHSGGDGDDEDETGPGAAALNWLYRGVLDVRGSAMIATHLTCAKPASSASDVTLMGLWDATERQLDDIAGASMRAIGRALASAPDASPTLVTLPVHYETLASRPRRTAFAAKLRRYQSLFCQHVVCSIVAGPERPRPEMLGGVIQELQHAFLHFDWQTDANGVDAERFRYSQLHSVTLNAPRCAMAATAGATGTNDMGRLRKDLHALKIRLGVNGVARVGELEKLREHGVDYAMGEAITDPLSAPLTARRVHLPDLPLRETTGAAA